MKNLFKLTTTECEIKYFKTRKLENWKTGNKLELFDLVICHKFHIIFSVTNYT